MDHTTHSSSWQTVTRPIISLASRVHAEWRHRQTERMLESLPSDIRKDIGWPTSDDTAGRIQ
jgi:hypothetical protein